MIEGLNHVTLSVRDIAVSLKFYTETLGFKPLARWKNGAYLSAGAFWLCLSLDKAARTQALAEYTHFAFTVALENFPAMEEKIRASAAPIWQHNSSEGLSLYFLDPNGHKLEIHASSLQNRLAACKENPYDGMIFFDAP